MVLPNRVKEDGGKAPAALRVLLEGGESAQRSELRRTLLALEEPPLCVFETEGSGAEAPRGAWGADESDVAMVVVDGDRDGAVARLQSHDRRKPRPAVFALLSDPTEPLVRRVLSAGADEVLVLPPEPHALMRVLLKVSEVLRRSQSEARARVFSLASVIGGVGVTTLSANLGLALQRSTGGRVALVDLDLQQGGLSVILNAALDRTILPLVGAAKKLDSISLESALVRHGSGLYLLAAPDRIEDSEQVTDLTVSAVVDLMSRLFDYIVIDCGRHIDENAIAAWERSTEVLYVLEQSVGAGRCTLRFLRLFERLRIGREPRLVLNRYDPRYPITEAQVAATLQRPIYARIPRDERLLEKAAALAKSPWQLGPRSALVRAYEELALGLSRERDLVAEPQAADASGFVTRLLAALGTHA
jgi:pilus assembly protein CpaE